MLGPFLGRNYWWMLSPRRIGLWAGTSVTRMPRETLWLSFAQGVTMCLRKIIIDCTLLRKQNYVICTLKVVNIVVNFFFFGEV